MGSRKIAPVALLHLVVFASLVGCDGAEDSFEAKPIEEARYVLTERQSRGEEGVRFQPIPDTDFRHSIIRRRQDVRTLGGDLTFDSDRSYDLRVFLEYMLGSQSQGRDTLHISGSFLQHGYLLHFSPDSSHVFFGTLAPAEETPTTINIYAMLGISIDELYPHVLQFVAEGARASVQLPNSASEDTNPSRTYGLESASETIYRIWRPIPIISWYGGLCRFGNSKNLTDGSIVVEGGHYEIALEVRLEGCGSNEDGPPEVLTKSGAYVKRGNVLHFDRGTQFDFMGVESGDALVVYGLYNNTFPTGYPRNLTFER